MGLEKIEGKVNLMSRKSYIWKDQGKKIIF